MLNMSASGILISSDGTLPPGSRVELVVEWPGFLHGTTWTRLAVFGEVMRSEGSRNAIRILRHEFRTKAETGVTSARSSKLHGSFTAA